MSTLSNAALEKIKTRQARIGIIGLGYVGLPVALSFGRKLTTVGFDIRQRRVDELKKGHDETLDATEQEALRQKVKLRTKDLLDTWERLDRLGIQPYWRLHHGVTISLYYADPMGVFDTHWSEKSWVTSRGLVWSRASVRTSRPSRSDTSSDPQRGSSYRPA